MKRNLFYVLAVATLSFGVVACTGKKAKEDEAAKEAAAAEAGGMTQKLLTAELKNETSQFLKDIPDFEIPYRIASKEVIISLGNIKHLLPVSKAAELTTASQKARAIGIYLADQNILHVIGQPTTEVSAAIIKLAADLNISFLADIVGRTVPAKATKEQYQQFYKDQEDQIITALAENDKINLAVEIVGGVTAEYACLIANPSLVVKGDATTAGLNENMERRLAILGEIVNDISGYYPELKELDASLTPLKEKLITIQTARDNSESILAIRDGLLK